jgi:hypothetical protein
MSEYEYVYYNALINNIDSKSDDTFTHEPNLVFNEQKPDPIIKTCENYEFAIESFKLDLKTLPVIIPTIKYDETNTNYHDTIYKVTAEITKNNILYSYSQRVEFNPQDKTAVLPTMKNGFADYSTGYYNVYNYEWFITLVNKALKDAVYKLKTEVIPGLIPDTISDYSPYFTFDKGTKLISLFAPRADFDESNTAPMSICLNKALYRLFNSLPLQIKTESSVTLIDGVIGQSDPQQVMKINLKNFYLSNSVKLYTAPKLDGTIYESTSTAIEYLYVYQDYTTFDSWSPVESICINSNTIPVYKSLVSANHTYYNGIEDTTGSLNVYELSITDFKAGSYEGGILYSPNEKRWMNLNQQEELKNINLSVFYRSKLTGGLIPIQLNSGGSFSCKMVFRKPK